VGVYCTNLIVAGLVLFAQVRYAAGRGRLFGETMDPRVIKFGGQRILMGPALYAVAMLVAFVSPPLSLAVCAVVPLLYILPGRVDRHWRPQDEVTGDEG
jgi:hypothetical protein